MSRFTSLHVAARLGRPPVIATSVFAAGVWVVLLLAVLSISVRGSAPAPLSEEGNASPAFNAVRPQAANGADSAEIALGHTDPDPSSSRATLVDTNVVYACARQNVGRTDDVSVGSPIWTDVTPVGVGSINDCIPDPWFPESKMWIVSSSGIWKGEKLDAGPIWSLVQSTYQITSTTDGHNGNGNTPDRIIASMSVPGAVFALYSHGGLGNAPRSWLGRSIDDGTTWTWTKIADEGEQARDFGFAISQNASSADDITIWASTKSDHLYKSIDGGMTFQRITSLPSRSFYQLHAIYSPLAGNDGSILYVGGGSSSRAAAFISRTLDGGMTWATISPMSGTLSRGPDRQHEMAGTIWSPFHLYTLAQKPQDVGAHENKKLYVSTDGGATWSLRQDFDTWGFEVVGVGVNAFDENRVYVIRDAGGATPNNLIFMSLDGGAGWVDKSGNWKSSIGNWTGGVAVWDTSYRAPSTYDLICPYYDFTGYDSNGFRQEIGSRAGVTKDGWRTVWDPTRPAPNKGQLVIQRGMTGDTSPLLQDLVDDPDSLAPIKNVRVEYSWLSTPGQVSSTLPATSTVNVLIELKYSDQYTSVTRLLTPAHEARGEDGRFVSYFDFANSSRPITQPTGLRVSLQLADPDQVIYLKRVALCFGGAPRQRPPIVPDGADEACADLLANIQSRSQPFGVSDDTPTASQGEFQFPSDVTLEPFPYRLNASGYPASLTYDSDLRDPASLVACAFKRNGQYHPDSANPIVRFTAVGGTPERREQLTLLNYAGYFSVGSPNWCYANDNVFATMNDRFTSDGYRPGYNVPTPKYPCSTGVAIRTSYGPCATFVAALYRAMGYFSVDGIVKAYQDPRWQSTVVNGVATVYYGVLYESNLRSNSYPYYGIDPLIVRTNLEAATYLTRPVPFAAIRAYSLYEPCGEFDSDKRFCLRGDHIYGDSVNDPRTWANDRKPLTVTLAPRGPHLPYYDPVEIWEYIKAGDIAITVIEQNDQGSEILTHIQIVVGWGPRHKNGQETRQGTHLYPTYGDIPSSKRAKYVPYVMDRYSLPGTGGTTGPRPFNYGLSSTATDFWVVDYTPTPFTQAFARAVKQILSDAAFLDRAPIPSQAQSEPIMPLPLSVPGSVAWSRDGNRIALGNQHGIALYTSNLGHATPLTEATAAVVALAWGPDSIRLASAEAAQQVTIWDVASGTRLAALKGHDAQLTGVAWSPSGNQIASSSLDGTIRIWNADTYALSTTLPYTGAGHVNALAWSPSGDRLAASDPAAIYVWDMASGQLLTSFPTEPWPAGSLTWTPDSQFLITPGAHRWDVTTGAAVSEYLGCSSGADTLVALSPDGRRLAGIGTAATGPSACLDRLDDQYEPIDQIFLQTYEGIDTLGSIAWSVDSQQLVLNTRRGWLSLWNANTGELLAAAPRLTTTPEELETLMQECVANDTLALQLTYELLTGDYAGFIAAVESQPEDVVDIACRSQLVKTAEFLMDNTLLPSPEPAEPQPLSLQHVCSSNPDEWVWRVRNPNSYDVPVVWGWDDEWPTPGAFPFVVPAASGGVPGEWLIVTPAQTGPRTLKILSGGFVATAQGKTLCSDIWLPVILRASQMNR